MNDEKLKKPTAVKAAPVKEVPNRPVYFVKFEVGRDLGHYRFK